MTWNYEKSAWYSNQDKVVSSDPEYIEVLENSISEEDKRKFIYGDWKSFSYPAGVQNKTKSQHIEPQTSKR